MMFRSTVPLTALLATCLLGCTCTVLSPAMAAEVDADARFRGVLESAGLGPEVLGQFSKGPDYQVEDWKLLLQLLHRLQQYSVAQQDAWAQEWSESPTPSTGELLDLVGMVESVETHALPEQLAQPHALASIYRCRFRFGNSGDGQLNRIGTVLSAQIPNRWEKNSPLKEPIRFRGILLRTSEDESSPKAVFLAQHLAWYPRQGVPTGQLLLARHGVDIALLDEVMQRRPFVRPEVSREGEAFYACLAAMNRIDARELSSLAKQNVAHVAEKWRAKKSGNRKEQALVKAILERSAKGLSSVAPWFLHPEDEVGELVRLEGTARRAVRIATEDQPKIESYYELEIFSPDSQNLPIVCCVNDLPEGFPTGDAIREPVRVAGIFFKSWLYRSRKVEATRGEAVRQQQLYTPLLIGRVPTWLQPPVSRESRWGVWGGIAFLLALAVLWGYLAKMARRERLQRSSTRHAKIEIFSNDTGTE